MLFRSRLAILIVGIAILSGTLSGVFPAARAFEADHAASLAGQDMSAMPRCNPGDVGGKIPQKLPMDCPSAMPCVAAPALALPGSVAVSQDLEWTVLAFPGFESRIAGITISPELSPPITIV